METVLWKGHQDITLMTDTLVLNLEYIINIITFMKVIAWCSGNCWIMFTLVNFLALHITCIWRPPVEVGDRLRIRKLFYYVTLVNFLASQIIWRPPVEVYFRHQIKKLFNNLTLVNFLALHIIWRPPVEVSDGFRIRKLFCNVFLVSGQASQTLYWVHIVQN